MRRNASSRNGHHSGEGSIQRVRPSLPLGISNGPVRALLALVGLLRHFKEGFAALDQLLIQPNSANQTTFDIALFTDPSNICSIKEREEGRCDCLQLPSNIQASASRVYGHRLVHVRLAVFNNTKARITDAWYTSLRELVPDYDVLVMLRPDSFLTGPMLIRSECWHQHQQPQQRHERHTSNYGIPISASRPSSPQTFLNNAGWVGYLACGATAAALMMSFDADEDDTPMISDQVMSVGLDLFSCP